MRLAPTLVAASSALLALGTRQSVATPRESALTRNVPASAVMVPVAGIPRFPARAPTPPPAPPAPSRMDTSLLARPLRPSLRECPMPVAGVNPRIGALVDAEVRLARTPGSMPIAPSACVNPLGR